MTSTCDRCGVELAADQLAYHVWIWVVARVNEEITEQRAQDVTEVVADAAWRRATLPESLIASDVYCRRSYVVCAACKERLIANPLCRSWE